MHNTIIWLVLRCLPYGESAACTKVSGAVIAVWVLQHMCTGKCVMLFSWRDWNRSRDY